MKNIKSFIKGINIETVASSSIDTEGDIEIFNNGLRIYLQAAIREVTTNDQTQTLTNKTINSDDNIITNIVNADIKATAAIDFSKLAALTSGNILVGNASNVAASVAMSGDITISNAGVTTIGLNKVANTQLAQMATLTIKGNSTGGTANASDLSVTTVTSMLNSFVGDSGSGGTKGLVPAPSAGDAAANKYLKASGAWAVAGDLAGPASSTDNAIARFDGTTGKLLQNSTITISDIGHIVGSNTATGNYINLTKTLSSGDGSLYKGTIYGEGNGDGVFGVDIEARGSVSNWGLVAGSYNRALSTIQSNVSSTLAGTITEVTNSAIMQGGSNIYGSYINLSNSSTAIDVTGVLIGAQNSGTITNYAGLSVSSASGTVSGYNDAIRVTSGRTYLAGSLNLNGATASTFAYFDSSKNVVSQSATQATALLNAMVGDSGSGGTKGLVPAPASGDAAASKFLKADGTWAVVSATGDVAGPASATDNALARFDGTTGKLIQNSSTTTLGDAGRLSLTPTATDGIGILVTSNNSDSSSSVGGVKVSHTSSNTGDISSAIYASTISGTNGVTIAAATLTVNRAANTAVVGTPLYIPTGGAGFQDYYGIYVEGAASSVTGSNNQALHVEAGESYFGGKVIVAAQNPLELRDTTGGEYVRIRANGTTTSYTLTMPAAQGAASTVLTNDGSGNLSWAAGGGGSGDILANGTVPFAANQSMGGFKLTSVGDPTAAQDAATKNYVDKIAVTSKTAGYTAVAGTDKVILCDATSASFTITLPAVSGNTGISFIIKKTDSTANTVTIDGSGSETIDGALTQIISTQYQSFTIVCNGTSWSII
jgi:hypothetical protein